MQNWGLDRKKTKSCYQRLQSCYQRLQSCYQK
nr:MAG TPA: hypothetical protein [Caudoviricetes sp.]